MNSTNSLKSASPENTDKNVNSVPQSEFHPFACVNALPVITEHTAKNQSDVRISPIKWSAITEEKSLEFSENANVSAEKAFQVSSVK